MEREGVPPKDVDHPSAAPRAVEEEEDRTSALLPTVPILTSPLPSIPKINSESQHSLREALQSEIAASSGSHSISSPLSTDRTFRELLSLQRTLAAEAEKQVQSIENEHHLKDSQQDLEEISSEERTERKTLCNQTRDRLHDVVDEPPMQRPRLENPASAIRWSKTDESGHWSLISVPETENVRAETDPEILWQQQVDDHVWENTGKPNFLFHEEWCDLFDNTRDNITAYVNFNQSKDKGLTATKMTRNDERPRHLIPESEWPRFLQATVAEWTAILDTSAITIISPTAAKDTREHLRHQIVPSRHVYREKPCEGVGAASKAKCRWCVLGHSIYTFLFVAAVLQREVTLGDLKSAFMQSDEDVSGRPKGKLYASLPLGGIPLPDGTWVEEGSLIQLSAAVYGLVNVSFCLEENNCARH